MKKTLLQSFKIPSLGGIMGGLAVLLAAFTMTACNEKTDDDPSLSVSSVNINVTAAAGSHTFAVTSNTAWTATVNAAATWCTISPAAATGNSTVTVNVTENTAAAARSATVTVSAGAFSHAVTVTQDGAPPVLDVAPATITAGSGAGSHSVTVTSNATWTVSVSAGATWCTVSPASAEGNGTVTVNVMENSTDATRSASVTFSAGTLTRTVEVEQASTPLDEPEPRTWIFGDSPLVWSDAIRIPACNKTSFTDSYSVPDCRSYTYEGNTWYYYNWTYVKMYASILCPSPWRLPDRWAFDELLLHADNVTLMQEWGYGGYIYDDGVWYTNEIGGYWSATQIDNFRAYHLLYSSVYAYNAEAMTNEGLQVRCVQ